ncbi:hypothetical protein [Chryseobacterium rhizosphaerae]|uniref:hypothetical protein n=1 Tax=Chryseobacterium rhizosphaerae TaxID=395937 RepID=UPI0023594006|nr:hypothetical protein [Chryseobacterium rhizosphaerae]MDC8102058.1 hypothetical protein [Chryseobacterium rhizosphaerae]
MKVFISIFIIFTVALRPVLPLVNYVVNYDYIVKNLCENRDIPQSTCKGKCYVEKELAKTEKQSNSSQTIKIAGLDVFLSHEILSFSYENELELSVKTPDAKDFNFHPSGYFSRIFHPPLA